LYLECRVKKTLDAFSGYLRWDPGGSVYFSVNFLSMQTRRSAYASECKQHGCNKFLKHLIDPWGGLQRGSER